MTTDVNSTAAFLDDLIGEPLSLGSLLLAIREADDVPQAELARRLGISRSHLCDIEKGRKVVSPERAASFADELGYGREQFVRLALQQLVEAAGLSFKVSLTAPPKAPRRRRAA